MEIRGNNIGKKFGKSWVFKDQNFSFQSGDIVGITGKNGAGKSTMLQLLSGFLTPSKGQILVDSMKVDEHPYHTVYIGPYTEIIEEFTLQEFLTFHAQFKPAMCALQEMADRASLPLHKRIEDFSTGMKQRTNLITAFYFKNDLIYMDEPTSNLDVDGFEWWKESLDGLKNQLVVIASNDEKEIECCKKNLHL